ncbi:MAG: vtpJ-therm [Myxococcales bacterium]|nr:vtpJ-therm [Myxococcales bacterium]
MRPLLALVLMLLTACGPGEPYSVLKAQGVNRYVGMAQIKEEVVQGIDRTVTFERATGPACLRGADYRVSTRETGADELMIFLAGGGACWKDRCTAIEEANSGIYPMGVLHNGSETNPFAAWNLLYLPYCDGSLFAGDVDIDDDGDGRTDRYHRGLRNLTAALDVGKATFPTPTKILLAGSSGGGFGTVIAAIAVRITWPEVPLVIMNDSGIGVAKEDDKGFIRRLLEEWNAMSLVPSGREDLLANGHLSEFIKWQLDEDPQLRVGAFSFAEDSVVSEVFLEIDPQQFCEVASRETAAINRAFPDRYRYFIAPGDAHTVLYSETGIGVTGSIFGEESAAARGVNLGGYDSTVVQGQSISQWMRALVAGSDAWVNRPVR